MPDPSLQKTARFGAFAIAAVWLAVAGVLYLVFERIEQNRQASLKPYALSSGDLDRGREGLSSSPPSEPCVRFSRTRLSSQWFPHRDWLAHIRACVMVNNPSFAK